MKITLDELGNWEVQRVAADVIAVQLGLDPDCPDCCYRYFCPATEV